MKKLVGKKINTQTTPFAFITRGKAVKNRAPNLDKSCRICPSSAAGS